ncbi:MAG: SH3 domain-containing protein [Eubacteriales bacterium]|nr:SH3 domain-containing protein [Eubacteriales bacterium]
MHFFQYILSGRRKRTLFSALSFFSAFYFLSLPVRAGELYTTDGVNIRSQPSASSEIYLAVPPGTLVYPVGQSGNWIQVNSGQVTGYIYKDYLSAQPDGSSPQEPSSFINSTEVNLRAEANGYCQILTVLEQGEEVRLLSTSGNWTQVRREDGTCGYVYSIYVGEKQGETAPKPSRDEVIAQYRSGALSYANGRLGDLYSQELRDCAGYADCSSLVRDAFLSSSGVLIGNTTLSQTETMMDYFYGLSFITDAQPGDLLYHLSEDNHVGIYLGQGRVLHASQSAGTVLISTYETDSSFWEYGCNAAAYCYDHSMGAEG